MSLISINKGYTFKKYTKTNAIQIYMKRIAALLLIVCMSISFSASAFFFFFFPIGGDSSSSEAKGNICVTSTAQVGEILSSPSTTNTAKILSVAGTSSRCKDPYPVLADVEFSFTATSKAGVNLSDEWEATPVSDVERYNGTIFKAKSKTTSNKALRVNFYSRRASSDMKTLANSIIERMKTLYNDSSVNSHQEFLINGYKALQFEFTGTTKATFSQQFTVLFTFIETPNEFIQLGNAALSSDYEASKKEFKELPYRITGLGGDKIDVEPKNAKPSLSIEDYKKTCADLGFKTGTESFGNCVLKLSK
jgi:hypothetical protein